jgi:hypothetical protein
MMLGPVLDTFVRFQIGDGGSGGGVVLRDVKWGARALAAAEEVLAEHFGDDIAMFAFKVSPKGYVYVRLDKFTNRFVSLQLPSWRKGIGCLAGSYFLTVMMHPLGNV